MKAKRSSVKQFYFGGVIMRADKKKRNETAIHSPKKENNNKWELFILCEQVDTDSNSEK